jgi:plasmid maintenance system killer protein
MDIQARAFMKLNALDAAIDIKDMMLPLKIAFSVVLSGRRRRDGHAYQQCILS